MEPAGRGERKLVTMLFADLSGFTALSETLDPEEVRELVNDCFDVLVPVVERCGGTVDKFIGDEIMALFGAPVAHEDDATRCLTAALGMMDAFGRWVAERGLELGLHIGVEAGTVVTGGLGSRGREEYSVVGDAVNLAARLADASAAGEVLVGPAARRLAEGRFEFKELAPLSLKGKAEPVPVCLSVRAKTPAGGGRYGRVASQLVGRDVEMQRLRAAVDALARGAGTALALVGEPGLGKSRLVAELRADSPEGVRWAEGKGQAYGQTASFAVAAGLLDDLAGVGREASAAEAEAALRAAVRSALPDPVAFAGVYPYLARLRDLPLAPEEDERVSHLAPEALRDRLRTAFATFVRAVSLSTPLVLVWEDLHWADASSLGVAEAVLPLTVDCPLISLFVLRPHEGDADEWLEQVAENAEGFGKVVLAPLDESASGMLVDGLLRVRNLSPSARSLIVDRAEGNPFFLEELMRSLLDAGLVVIHEGAAVATGSLTDLIFPDTVHGVAAARIDALAAVDKNNLQRASVIGRTFQRPVLATLRERSVAEDESEAGLPLDDSLGELCRRELIREHSELEYLFKHAVTREVAYGSLLKARRRALHGLAAEVIEELYPDRLDELSATLAHHWRAAGAHDRAYGCLVTAAERASRTYSSAEALELYRQALEEAGDDVAKRTEISERLGDLLDLGGRHDEARKHLEDALEGATEELRRARLLRKLADTHIWVDAERAAVVFAEAEQALGPVPPGESEAWWHECVDIQCARLRLAYWTHDVSAMGAWLQWATATLELPEVRGERGTLMRMLVLHELGATRYQPTAQSLLWVAEYVEAAEQSGDPAKLAEAYFLSAFVLTWRGDVWSAVMGFERTIDVCRRIGDVNVEVRALTYLAVNHRRLGDVGAVRVLADEALRLTLAAGLDPYLECSARGNLAWVAWRGSDVAAARVQSESALALTGRIRHAPFFWMGLWPLLAVRLTGGDVAGAVELARRLIDPAQMKLPDELEVPLGASVEAWEAGDRDAAAGALRLAVERAEGARFGWL